MLSSKGALSIQGQKTDEDRIATNLLYLKEHGMMKVGRKVFSTGDDGDTSARIAARGIDFLEEDARLRYFGNGHGKDE